MSQEHSEAETVLNSFSSDLSYSSLPSLKIETETPTVTELSFGLFTINCELLAPPASKTVTFMCRFNVKHQPLKKTSTFEITFHRSTSALGSVNWFRLTCCAPTNDIAATPNCLPRFVNLDDGDGKMLDVSPTSGTFTH